jgi:hypothetical protein
MKALSRLYAGSIKAHIQTQVGRGSRGGGGVRESEDGVGGREEVVV